MSVTETLTLFYGVSQMSSNKFSKKFQRVIDAVVALGCDVKIVSPYSSLLNAPFSAMIGLNYKKKVIYLTEDEDDNSIGGFIHEAGHVLACPYKPEASNEFDFLGWEIAMAISCDVLPEWLHGQRDYVVDANEHGIYSVDIGTLTEDRVSELVEERLDYARSVGIIDTNDRPLVVRRITQKRLNVNTTRHMSV